MSTGYVRQSAAEIVDAGVIYAASHNAEYNQIAAAFNESTGHNHDGTVGGGKPLGTAALGSLTNTSAGLIVANGADNYVVRTLTGPAAGITVTNGSGVSGNPTLALANDLAALEAMSGTGLVARTASETYAQRTITAGSNISVTNGDGVSGNPTIALTGIGSTIQAYDAGLDALAAFNTPGILVQTADNTFVGRTLTGTTNRITVTNGAGINGNPTVDIASTYVGQSSITTLGTIGTGTWQGTLIGSTYGGTGVNNAGRTITVAGNFATAGANALTLTTTGTTNVTLPTTGTLVNSAVTTLSSLASVGTITSGTWNATTIAVNRGGTGLTTLTANNVILGNGTSTPQFVAPGSSGNVLTSNGTTWQSTAPTTSPKGHQVITSGSGNFTVPANATATTRFKFTLTGGGGGSGGVNDGASSGGGAGTTAIYYVTGLTASSTHAYVIGTGGAAGTSAPGNGGNGTATTIDVAGTLITAPGGVGSVSETGGAVGRGGSGGAAATNATISIEGGGGSGGVYQGNATGSGVGGASFWGGGGRCVPAGTAAQAGKAYGSGAGGAFNGSPAAGAAGASGILLVEWD
jgi:hypothetical protein